MKRLAGIWAGLAARLPRDKADTLLLMLSALLVLAPHLAHLPPWISAGVVATLLWRSALTLRGARLPPLKLLLPVALLAMAGVYASFGTLLGRDAGVAMLALLLALKLLEMHARRDLFVVLFLSLFLMLTSFFYSQSMASALFAGLTLIVLLCAQLTFQYSGQVPPLARRVRLAAGMAGAAVPLALLLFVAFPRIQGPLWGLPGDAGGGARTGLSDSMAPGNVSKLAQSDEIAFRVRFSDRVPGQPQLYWRGIVLNDYDGRTWTRGAARRAGANADANTNVNIWMDSEPVRYQVTLEPSGRRWIYALDLPERLYRLEGNPYAVSSELETFVQNPIAARVRYNVSSVLDYRLQADMTLQQMGRWLALPAGYNPRALAWAASLRGTGTPEAGMAAVLQAFRSAPFRYTLEPPLLGRDAVDQFLFDSKAGFCEHYAGAFVVLMRAMGVPARVVTGYQGGELNPVDGYLTVRQSDAHAWAEVWLAGSGWRRVDPTAAVAPERIEHNLARALPARPPSALGALGRLIGMPDGMAGLLPALRLNWNAVNNAWNQWVLDYNPERQRGVLAAADAAFGNRRGLLGGAAIVVLLWLAHGWRARRRRDPLATLYAAFCARHARLGYPRAPDEGPHRYALRLAAAPGTPARKAARARFLAIYGAMQYGVAHPDQHKADLRTLGRLLKHCR